MKWIQWDGRGGFGWRDTCPVPARDYPFVGYLNQEDIDCEKDTSWREIESGVLDTGTGKLKITLKPVVKVPTLRDAAIEAVGAIGKISPADIESSYSNPKLMRLSKAWRELKDALDREDSTPANPYTKEAVDDLLDAAREANGLWFAERDWAYQENKRLSRAFIALKKQREAANA